MSDEGNEKETKNEKAKRRMSGEKKAIIYRDTQPQQNEHRQNKHGRSR